MTGPYRCPYPLSIASTNRVVSQFDFGTVVSR